MRALLFPGNLLILALLLATAVTAIGLEGAPVWSAGAAPVLNFLGRLAGVLGMVLLLVAALVSIRIPRLDLYFGGITELWKVHHVLGAASFVLLLLHPLLLAFARLTVSPQSAAAVLVPQSDGAAVWVGWGALLAMMVFLAPTFYFFGRPHYQLWKAIHAVSAAAILLAVGHTVALARTLPVWSWWLLAIATAAALFYRLVLRKIRPGRPYIVSDVRALAHDVIELTLTPQSDAAFAYQPGQFMYLSPLDPELRAGRREEHPYTLSSAPSEPHLRTAIKALGDATSALQHVAPGSTALVDGPYGRFFESGAPRAELWIGGGIGITPFVGRARSLSPSDATLDIHAVYCVNSPERAYYLSELESIAARVPGFHLYAHYFESEGPLNREWLAARVPDFAAREIYVCGPDALIRPVRAFCRHAGVPARRFHSEAFTFL